MRVKKVRRICGVKGCKSKKNVFSLSKGREFGNSVVICKDCLEEGLKAVNEFLGETNTDKKEVSSKDTVGVTSELSQDAKGGDSVLKKANVAKSKSSKEVKRND